YKEISNVVSRLQNQMRTGLGDSSIERTTEQIERLKRQLDSVYAQMNSSSQARMDMFDASRATRDLADMNRNLSRIEDMATQASARLNGLGDNIDTDKDISSTCFTRK
ncbi:hypothetical protein, partial [Clostridioides difficile]|uniref:hypothetical protein n=1 Tax=Clostridioides difficile TaxID=1496 RepID=UPI001CA5B25F